MSRHSPPPRSRRRAFVVGAVVLLPATVLLGRCVGEDFAGASLSQSTATTQQRMERSAPPLTPTNPERPTPDAEPVTTEAVTPAATDEDGRGPATFASRSSGVVPDRPGAPVGSSSSSPEVRPAGPELPVEGPAPDVVGEAPAVKPGPQPDPIVALGMPEIINRERLAHGCGPIAVDPDLQAYAEEVLLSPGPEEVLASELLASGHDTAVEAVGAWMSDEQARAEILTCDYAVIGYAVVGDDWVLVLA